ADAGVEEALAHRARPLEERLAALAQRLVVQPEAEREALRAHAAEEGRERVVVEGLPVRAEEGVAPAFAPDELEALTGVALDEPPEAERLHLVQVRVRRAL